MPLISLSLLSGKFIIDATEIIGNGSYANVHDYALSLGCQFFREEILEAVKDH